MGKKYDVWAVKNRWGSILWWTMSNVKKGVIQKVGKEKWKEWKKMGGRIIKIKFIEIE